jgi:hypothetical protein
MLTCLQTNEIFSIANITFEKVGAEEKQKYTGQTSAIYEGYKPKQTWVRTAFSI